MEILVAGWDSGGGVEVVQAVVRRAAERGHHVRVLGTEGLRGRFESAGAEFLRYRYAPENDTRSAQTDLVKDWEARTPIGLFARVRDRGMFGPAREFCRDVTEELHRAPADVAVVDTLIPSALSAAEAAGVPSVLLMHGPYLLPRPGVPAIGTGFLPARGPSARCCSACSAPGCRRSTRPAPSSGWRRWTARWTSPWLRPGSWCAPARALISPPMRCPVTPDTSDRSSTTAPVVRGTIHGPASPAARWCWSASAARSCGRRSCCSEPPRRWGGSRCTGLSPPGPRWIPP